jgi:hypothetical protein
MECRALQNRARHDIPTRHEARHNIVTRDLAMTKYTVPREFTVEYSASLYVLPELLFPCLPLKFAHRCVSVLVKGLTMVKEPAQEPYGIVAK